MAKRPKSRKLYDTLGVSPEATAEQIKSAHRKRVRQTHPDRDGDRQEFDAVQAAALVLLDPDRRRAYDETGETGERVTSQTFHSLLAEVFISITVETVQAGRKIKHLDLVKEMARQLGQALFEIKAQCDAATKAIADLEESRVLLKEPADALIAMLFDQQIAKLHDAARPVLEAKRTHEEAIAYLSKCGFEFVRAAPQSQSPLDDFLRTARLRY